MTGRRVVLFIALGLVAAGAAGAVAVGAPDATTSLSSGGATDTTAQGRDDDARQLVLPDDIAPTTTTTLATTTTVTPPTTVAIVTTTTAPQLPTTTTAPVDNGQAQIYVENKTSYEVRVSISDDNSTEWVLAPGQKVGPWTLLTSNEHGDGGSAKRTDVVCGVADGEDYFKGGHTYNLEVVDSTNTCGDERTSPRLLVRDLTTGTSDYLE